MRVGSPVPAPELPADEALEGGVALVDKAPPAAATEGQGLLEGQRLPVVEDVALAVVSGRRAGRLVSELGAPLDRQCLQPRHHLPRYTLQP